MGRQKSQHAEKLRAKPKKKNKLSVDPNEKKIQLREHEKNSVSLRKLESIENRKLFCKIFRQAKKEILKN